MELEYNTNADWELIKQEYIESKGTIPLKELAERYNVNPCTLRTRKHRENWDLIVEEVKKLVDKEKMVIQSQLELTEKSVDRITNAELTDKQKLFCIYYVKYFNATKAAIKAGYSPNCAAVLGHNNLAKPEIRKEIQALKRDRFKGAFLEPEDLLQKYIDIAFADVGDYLDFGQKEVKYKDDEGKTQKYKINYVDFKDSKEVDTTIISEVTSGKNGVGLKLQDKMKALDFLAEHIGLLSIEQQHKMDIEREKLGLARRKVEVLEKDKNGDNDDDIIYEVEENEED